MTRIEFIHHGDEWWFDPESGEYEYDGPSALIDTALAQMEEYDDIQTGNLYGVTEHPGEVWTPLPSEERKDKVIKFLTRIDGVQVHDRK